ncbi:Serine/threonine-protein phosphatase 6 regulatory ankyrin repeat subunit C [Madurella mycetomatis]|uniref:Serine/threonine-protein phosphatase 6 regulatory ankyrin repeat subunit C n=1 Tax=Madurella mycetomatis TaxID=100816 RepID=A0A175WHL1_9PEZI|nr:Serine/threonine-protein phosphatase 6 regulatory ankyrin repeat subunit C [Madurella mycetomatis]
MYPFLSYAPWAWYYHSFHEKPQPPQDIMTRTQKAFDPSIASWRVWTPADPKGKNTLLEGESGRLETADGKANDGETNAELWPEVVLNPIYYVSLLGLTDVVKSLEGRGLDCSCKGGRFGFPLQAAVAMNRVETAKHLVSLGIDVLQTGGVYGAAIVAAAAASSNELVRVLLDAGVDLKPRMRLDGFALR